MTGEAVFNFVLNVDCIIWLSAPLKMDKFLSSYYQQISDGYQVSVPRNFIRNKEKRI